MNTLTQFKQSCRQSVQMMKLLASRPSFMLKPVQYVFVFSHMRSRSTLLAHLLGSHPEISGYLETHLRYWSKLDFLRLRQRVSEALDGASLGRYVMDKVLHDWYIDIAMIERMKVIPLFLIRDAEETIVSLCRSTIIKAPTQAEVMRKSTDHYVKRLKWMEKCAMKLTTRGMLIHSTDLVERTEPTLRMVEERLELSSPLSESYQLFKATGQPVYGDFSDNIKSGRIVREEKKGLYTGSEIPAALLHEARSAHDRCMAALKQRCAHVA